MGSGGREDGCGRERESVSQMFTTLSLAYFSPPRHRFLPLERCLATSEHHDHHSHDHSHDLAVSSFSIVCEGRLDLEKVQGAMGKLITSIPLLNWHDPVEIDLGSVGISSQAATTTKLWVKSLPQMLVYYFVWAKGLFFINDILWLSKEKKRNWKRDLRPVYYDTKKFNTVL
ncbi:product protein [Spatholobus suberectus]|nr:product protein [Spatholobus suberectus]